MNHQYKTIEELSHDLNVAMERTDILKKVVEAQHDQITALFEVLLANQLISQKDIDEQLLVLRLRRTTEEAA